MYRVTEYAKKVMSGEIIAGQFLILACERHLRDLEKSKKIESSSINLTLKDQNSA